MFLRNIRGATWGTAQTHWGAKPAPHWALDQILKAPFSVHRCPLLNVAPETPHKPTSTPPLYRTELLQTDVLHGEPAAQREADSDPGLSSQVVLTAGWGTCRARSQRGNEEANLTGYLASNQSNQSFTFLQRSASQQPLLNCRGGWCDWLLVGTRTLYRNMSSGFSTVTCSPPVHVCSPVLRRLSCTLKFPRWELKPSRSTGR